MVGVDMQRAVASSGAELASAGASAPGAGSGVPLLLHCEQQHYKMKSKRDVMGDVTAVAQVTGDVTSMGCKWLLM